GRSSLEEFTQTFRLLSLLQRHLEYSPSVCPFPYNSTYSREIIRRPPPCGGRQGERFLNPVRPEQLAIPASRRVLEVPSLSRPEGTEIMSSCASERPGT